MGIRVADILAAGPCRVFTRGIPTVVYRAYRAIIHCHTWGMGGHAVVCPNGHVECVSYNACRNRSCPHCAAYRIRLWLERQVRTLQPTLLGAIAGRPLRDVAKQTGVSAPTLSRILRGHPPDLTTFMKLMRWITP